MHEKDIELVKLLHQNCTESEERLARLKDDLDACKTELDSIEETISSREGFSDILREAATALEREDLVVEVPDSAELSARCEELTEEFTKESDNSTRFRGLLDQLTDRAPGLLEAAGLKPLDPQVEEDDAVDEETTEAADSAENENESAGAEDEEESNYSEFERFNLKTIRRREKSGHGPGAVYIIDGNSVLSRIPAYDFSQRELEETAVYEELARDLKTLGDEISGTFCILADSPIKLDDSVGGDISVVSPSSNGASTSEDRLNFLLRLADEYTGRLRNVCVVSGESDVLAEVRNRGMHTMGLSEFFVA
jgi:hypothetical protein